jgi:hypothetical protein
MPQQVKVELIRDRMPVSYRVHPLIRFSMIGVSTLIGAYALYFLFTYVYVGSPWLVRFLPIMILFVALDSVLRHVTSLNSVIFTPECLWLRFLLKPSLAIPWDKITSMEFRKFLTYYVYIGYIDGKGNKRVFKTNASFPKMLEVMYNIADLAPTLVMDEKLDKMIAYLREITNREDNPQT